MIFPIPCVVGPTACGKTTLAVRLCAERGAELLSADSRQVFRGMDIGTGKDFDEYTLDDGRRVPYHLIDIREPGEPYNIHNFQSDVRRVLADCERRGVPAVMCGGSGLYVEAVLRGYDLSSVATPDAALRAELDALDIDQLRERLLAHGPAPEGLDLRNPRRLQRAIENLETTEDGDTVNTRFNVAPLEALVIGLDVPREVRRERIRLRLEARLNNGLVEEVQRLLDQGVPPQTLINYGLEYKFVTLHCLGRLTRDECQTQLLTAIQRFAKRQVTWFRGMERRGVAIHWIDATVPIDQQLQRCREILATNAATNRKKT